MSKNVAVFVDVANIFYAAKAAGVDIDYVTLLKSATAGRDFVRAYAYTGLDPENENQRQFHAFLARSGYKVVSKDIRKYGDGRIKANLDIELVVDMMRMGEKLDIAVVISGDGDFAPAIVAVQQMGVRVEVISFRGNTSSDLIDVADAFIDITSVAKVEKGVRSGRRVATDGDLSMTEVPDKESGVTPRRRRRRDDDEKAESPETAIRPARRVRTTRPAEPATSTPVGTSSAAAGALVALPGEKLSRRADVAVEPEAYAMPGAFAGSDELAEVEAPAPIESLDRPFGDQVADDGSGRRRRRRRGGRGRGRGGRADEPGVDGLGADGPGADGPDADESVSESELTEHPAESTEYADEVPTLPQLSGFGSVWDSQIAGPSRKTIEDTRPGWEEGEDLDGEPEIPEYLLAEKRQQGRRPARGGRPGGGVRQGGGYRSAIDRERYGSGPRSGVAAQGRGDQGNRLSSPTPARRRSSMSMEPIEQTRGGDQWSEVPPEVQALLKAELARRGATSNNKPSSPAVDESAKKASGAKPSAAASQADAAVADEAPKKPSRRKPSAKATTADAAVADEAPKKPSSRKPSAKASQADTSIDIEAAPKKPSRRKPSAKAATADTGADIEASEA